MKVLFVSAVLPYPLYSGGQVRAYNLLRELSKSHEITLCSFVRSEDESKEIKNLDYVSRVEVVNRGRAWQPKYVLSSLGKYPFLLNTYDKKEMREKIGDLIARENFDGIHIEPFYVWPSLPETSLPIVAGEHNIEYDVYGSYVKHLKIPVVKQLFAYDVAKMKKWEQLVWQRVNQVVAVSEEERQIISKFNPKTTVVPNGVDAKYFSFNKNLQLKPLTILFVGSFRWMQNRDAVRELVSNIWPKVKNKYPEAKLRIVGKSADELLKTLIREKDGELIEGVEDIREEFKKATALLAPIRIGGGTSYKILETMASGLPVVTSELGATGLEVVDGKELCVCKSEEGYLKSIDRIITEESFREKLRKAARDLVEEKYSWKKIAGVLDNVWQKTYGKQN